MHKQCRQVNSITNIVITSAIQTVICSYHFRILPALIQLLYQIKLLLIDHRCIRYVHTYVCFDKHI